MMRQELVLLWTAERSLIELGILLAIDPEQYPQVKNRNKGTIQH